MPLCHCSLVTSQSSGAVARHRVQLTPVDHPTIESLDVVVRRRRAGQMNSSRPALAHVRARDQSVRCVHYCVYMPRKPEPRRCRRDRSFVTPPTSKRGWQNMSTGGPGCGSKIAKKGSGIPSLTDQEAVDLGLCYGWISGQRKAYDEVYYLQLYVPRRPRSRWSQVNVRRVEALIAAGRMRPSGLAEVEAAKADGRWDAAYESQRDATVPPDLAAALAANPRGGQGLRSAQQNRPVRRDPGYCHCPQHPDSIGAHPQGRRCPRRPGCESAGVRSPP